MGGAALAERPAHVGLSRSDDDRHWRCTINAANDETGLMETALVVPPLGLGNGSLRARSSVG